MCSRARRNWQQARDTAVARGTPATASPTHAPHACCRAALAPRACVWPPSSGCPGRLPSSAVCDHGGGVEEVDALEWREVLVFAISRKPRQAGAPIIDRRTSNKLVVLRTRSEVVPECVCVYLHSVIQSELLALFALFALESRQLPMQSTARKNMIPRTVKTINMST